MQKECFTNHDLAKAMGLEVGDEIIIDRYICYTNVKATIDHDERGDIGFKIGARHHELFFLIGNTYQKVDKLPALTDKDRTILQGRLAEGCTDVALNEDFAIVYYGASVGSSFVFYADRPFKSFKQGCVYSIEKLLNGE